MKLGMHKARDCGRARGKVKANGEKKEQPPIFPKMEYPKELQLLDELNVANKEEYENWLYRKLLIEKILGKSTLIIGVRATDGIVLGGDRKVMRGGETDFENKVRTMQIKNAPIMFAAAGMVGIIEDFLETFEETLTKNIKEGKVDSLLSVKITAENFVETYNKTYGPKFGEPSLLTFILGGLSELGEGGARLYKIGFPGYGEIIKHYSLVGHGSDYARTVGKYLFPRHSRTGTISLPCDKIISRIAASIYWVGGEVDDYVGGDPQIGYMLDKQAEVKDGKYSKEKVKKQVDNIKKALKNISFETQKRK